MSQLAPVYNTHRMVQEYTEKFYLNAHRNRKELLENDWQKVKEFTQWKTNLIANWDKLKFVSVSHAGNGDELKVGSKYKVSAEVNIGNLTNDDIEVQIYYGKVDNVDEANENSYTTMTCVDCKNQSGTYKFEGSIKCNVTGEFGYTLRILPKHSLLINQFELGAIRWVSLIKE